LILSANFLVVVFSPQIEDLLADLGGQAGLWLGVSVIAIFELIELVYDVISVAALRRIRNLSCRFASNEHAQS